MADQQILQGDGVTSAPRQPAAGNLALHLYREAMAGLTAMLFILPIILSTGAVVYLPLGTAHLSAGVAAAFVTAIIGALVLAAFGWNRLHLNAPRTTQAAILATLMANIAAMPTVMDALPQDPGLRMAALMAVPCAGLALAGLGQLVLGLLRLGDLVKYVPQTVVAGFVAGFVVQVVLIQIPMLFAQPDWAALRSLAATSGTLPVLPPAIGLLAALAALLVPRLTRAFPAALAALVLGGMAHALLTRWLPGEAAGPLIGSIPADAVLGAAVEGWSILATAPVWGQITYPVVATGIMLAFITSIQSLLSAAMADSLVDRRYDSNRELFNQGACNLTAALAGGTSAGGSPLLTRTAFDAGGRTGLTNLFMAVSLTVVVWQFSGLVSAIPLSVMAAVVVVQMLQSLDPWSVHLLRALAAPRAGDAGRRELLPDFAVFALVAALVAFVDVLSAIGVGMLATMVVFLRRAGGSAIRRVYFGDTFQSHTARAPVDAERLDQHGRTIAVVELQGPVFFGTADAVGDRLARIEAQEIILDLRRVSDVDSTGALVLKRIDATLAAQGRRLALAGLAPGNRLRRFLEQVGFTAPEREGRVWTEPDSALADAEDRVLAKLDADASPAREMTLREHPALAALEPGHIDMLEVFARRLEIPAGAPIFRIGDAADAVYLVAAGEATRQIPAPGGQHAVRQNGYRAGAILGEQALLGGGKRTADVVADTDMVVYRLLIEDLLTVESVHPRAAMGLARHIAERLMDRLDHLRAVQWAKDL